MADKVKHVEIEESGASSLYDIQDESAARASDLNTTNQNVTAINTKIGNENIGAGVTITAAIKALQLALADIVSSVDGQTGVVDLSNVYAPISHVQTGATASTSGHVTLTDTIENDEGASASKAVSPHAVKSESDTLRNLIAEVRGEIPSLDGYVKKVNNKSPNIAAGDGAVSLIAGDIPYSNSTSGLSSTNAQGAIDELKAALQGLVSVEANRGVSSNSLQNIWVDGIGYTIDSNISVNGTTISTDPLLVSITVNGQTYRVASSLSTTSIGDLGDVVLENLEDGQILVYDATNDCWVNQDNSGGGGAGVSSITVNDGTPMTGAVSLTLPQIDTLPTASVDNLGKIFQYTGATGPSYINGYFYKCTTSDNVTYAWTQWNVQPSSGGTDVEANPSGSATTELEKLRVGNIIYSIPEDGGAEIDDTTTALNKVWSSDKTNTEIGNVPSTNNYNVLKTTSKTLTGAINELFNDKNIATLYNAASTYSVDDFCIYEGTLYKCKQEISTAEAFTPAHWDATVVTSELGGTTGSSTLAGLTDVDLTSVANGQILKYNSTTGKWENVEPTSGVEIDDTTTSSTKTWSSNKIDSEIGKVPNTNTYNTLETTSKTLIGAINEVNKDKNVSDAYDDTATYDVGDYCIYNSVLYKCNTAIAVAESFTPAKWTATTVAKELEDNKIILTGTLTAGQTTLTFTDASIQNDSWLTLAPENVILYPTGVTTTTGSVTYTFAAQQNDVVFQLRVLNK